MKYPSTILSIRVYMYYFYRSNFMFYNILFFNFRNTTNSPTATRTALQCTLLTTTWSASTGSRSHSSRPSTAATSPTTWPIRKKSLGTSPSSDQPWTSSRKTRKLTLRFAALLFCLFCAVYSIRCRIYFLFFNSKIDFIIYLCRCYVVIGTKIFILTTFIYIFFNFTFNFCF